MRLNRYIATCGITSRRKADLLIRGGRISVNGEVVYDPGRIVHPDREKVLLDGKVIHSERRIVLLLNKPKGVLTTLRRQGDRPIITSLLKGVKERVFPVGRLDLDTEGLLLLTNDGDLAYRLTHPKFQVERAYEVWVDGSDSGGVNLKRIREGVKLEDGIARAKRAEILKRKGNLFLIRITLTEGRKREVKRIFEKIGAPVVSLKRVKFGLIELGELPSGKFRKLNSNEIGKLENITNVTS